MTEGTVPTNREHGPREALPFVAPCRKISARDPLEWVRRGWAYVRRALAPSMGYFAVIAVLSRIGSNQNSAPHASACRRWARPMMIALAIAVASVWGFSQASQGRFENTLQVRTVEQRFETALQLEEDLAYRDAGGKLWQAERGQVFDGSGFPPLFHFLMGPPLESTHPRSKILYESMTQKKREDWDKSRRMFYEAALTEGVERVEAKLMYLVLAVQGSRWETPDSSCYGSCHRPDKPLHWRPVVKEPRVAQLGDWVRKADPSIAEIDRAAAHAIRATGPHIVTQPNCSNVTSVLTRYRLNCD